MERPTPTRKNAFSTVALVLMSVALYVGGAQSQTISIFDTVYTPPGDPDGSWIATMFVPVVGNGIGVVLAHGTGVSRTAVRGWCDTLAARGYVAMTVEYPDAQVYPNPPRSLKLAVQFLRRNAARFGITTNRIVGLGTSGGAITWGEAMIWDNDYRGFNTDSTISDRLDAAVLLYGRYHDSYSDAYDRAYFRNDSLLLVRGSPELHAANITTPVLLMHGTADATLPYQRSMDFYDSLIANGKTAELVLFPEQPHGFDLTFPDGRFTAPGLVAKDTALAFLQRTVAPALRIRVSSSIVDFGALLVSSRDTMAIRLDNIGDSVLQLASISNLHSEYHLLGLPSFPSTIQPGGSLQLNVAFQPAARGLVNDTIHFASDDPLHPVVNVAVHGKGVSSILPATEGVMYATSAAQPGGYLFRMTIPDGRLDTIGSLGVPDVRGMSIRHSDGLIYATAAMSASTGLYQIDATTGEAALLWRLHLAGLNSLAFNSRDTLYGATEKGALYRIDPASGRADSLGTSSGLAYSGLSFRPSDGELWASVRTPTDSIFRLNRDNGTVTLVGATGFNAVTSSIAFDSSGTLYGLIDNGTGEDYLATIDTLTGAGTVVAGPLSVPFLRAITKTGGILLVSVKDEKGGDVPRQFALEQNFPNPFNPTTTLGYSVGGVVAPSGAFPSGVEPFESPQGSTLSPPEGRVEWVEGPAANHVKLVVYDVLGREVAVLVNEQKAPGTYTVQFDGSRLASGVYFYRMTAGSFVDTKKLVLLR